jgi:hypothetical protein
VSAIPVAAYTAKSKAHFMFFSTPLNQSMAQAECLKNGGHLAAYTSEAEQDEVEKYYVEQVGCRAAVRTLHATWSSSAAVSFDQPLYSAHACQRLLYTQQ